MQEAEVPFLRLQINESGLDPDIGPKDLSVAIFELAVRIGFNPDEIAPRPPRSKFCRGKDSMN